MGIFRHPPSPNVGGRQPLEGAKLPPALLAVEVNNPPFTHWGRVAAAALVVALCQPPAPQAFMGGRQPLEQRKLNPALLNVEQGFVPFTSKQAPWQQALWYAQPRQVKIATTASSFVPFVRQQFYSAPLASLPQRQVQIAPLTVQVNNPPFSSRKQLNSASWAVQFTMPPRPVQFVHSVAAVAEKVPFVRAQLIVAQLVQWPRQRQVQIAALIEPAPAPATSRKYVSAPNVAGRLMTRG